MNADIDHYTPAHSLLIGCPTSWLTNTTRINEEVKRLADIAQRNSTNHVSNRRSKMHILCHHQNSASLFGCSYHCVGVFQGGGYWFLNQRMFTGLGSYFSCLTMQIMRQCESQRLNTWICNSLVQVYKETLSSNSFCQADGFS